jgi:hypothetical protein
MNAANRVNANGLKSSGIMGGMVGIIVRIVFVIIALVALYYLYEYLYGTSDFITTSLTSSIQTANFGSKPPLIADTSVLPALYEGGELSVSAWIYINDYTVRNGYNKHVLSIGGDNFSTLVVFLGPYKNSLSVRVQTQSPNPSASTPSSSTPSTSASSANLTATMVNSMFTTLSANSDLTASLPVCDITSIDLQRWILVNVVLNNNTCDVYLDGKLARSCILPSFYRVDVANRKSKICDHGGFGGFIGQVNAYNYALNPEQVWRLYMAGPGPQHTLMSWLMSLIVPTTTLSNSVATVSRTAAAPATS